MQWQRIGVLFLFGNILTAGTLHLKTRIVETADLPADYQSSPGKHWRRGTSHYLLQFRAPVSEANRIALAERGAVVTGTVPDNAVTVSAGDDFNIDGLDLEYAGRLSGLDKVSPLVNKAADGSAFLVEFHSDVSALDALQLLEQQNLAIWPHADLEPNHFLISGTVQEVLALQDWDEVDYIFPASNDLVADEHLHACAGALSTAGSGVGISSGQYVLVGHGWTKDKTGVAPVGYFFSDLTPKVPAPTVKSDIQRAFAEWAQYAPLQFQLAAKANTLQAIDVWFAAGDHGDGFTFTSDILAHTFYPSNPEPIAGDLHMNLDEPWKSGGNIDIYTVALHEAGHALGLGHSDKPGAIMYPYYRLGAQISADDIAGIQAIYGRPLPAAAPPATPLTLNITTPAAQTTAAAVAITGTTANGVGTTVVNWQTDSKTSGRASGAAAWSASVPLVVGTNTVTVTATDGNHSTATQSVVMTRTVPPPPAPAPTSPGQVQGPPVIAVTSPTGTIVQTNQTSLTITGTASATAVRVSWQNGPMGSGNATGIATWSASVPLLAGTNTLIFRAWDASGNSSWRSLTVVKR